MRFAAILTLFLLAPACAHLSAFGPETEDVGDLWGDAHEALYEQRFADAEQIFTRIQDEHPETREGREALFFVGLIRLDPRNPDWDPEPAETALRSYLAEPDPADETERRRATPARVPEARAFLELARQLNLPPAERVAGLAPETRVEVEVQRVVVPAQQATDEAAALRARIAERDAEIRRLREELDRIRRTLAPPDTTP
jgi:hypothetical protein